MNSEKNIQPVNLQIMQADYSQEDEISLVEIWWILFEYKYHILAITFICSLAALVYALLAQPVYQAKAVLLSPRQAHIEGLQASLFNINKGEVFSQYIVHFNSYKLRKKFFQDNNLIKSLVQDDTDGINEEVIFNNSFSQLLTFEFRSYTEEDKKESVIVQLLAPEAELSAKWLNKFIDFIENETLKSIKEDIASIVSHEIVKKNNIINKLRLVSAQQILNQIYQLSEEERTQVIELENKIRVLKNVSNIKFKDNVNSIENKIRVLKNISNIKFKDNVNSIENKIRVLKNVSNIKFKDNVNSIENKIKLLKQVSNTKLEDRVVSLENSIIAARELDKINPVFQLKNPEDGTPSIMINTGNIPQYTRGVKALNAEIESVKMRKDNEAFIDGLRDTEYDLRLLNSQKGNDFYITGLRDAEYEIELLNSQKGNDFYITGLRDAEYEIELLKTNYRKEALKTRINNDAYINDLAGLEIEINQLRTIEQKITNDSSIKLIRIDQYARVPDQKLKPSRRNIVLIGVFAGLLIGVIFAIILNYFKKIIKQQEQE